MTPLGEKHRRVQWLIAIIAVLVVLLAGGIWYRVQGTGTRQDLGAYQQMMSLTQLDKPRRMAPNFTLTDQNGAKVSLSSLRGNVVALEFIDPVCTDICPIVSQEFVDADRLLGQNQQNVVFLAVNVNEYHKSRADVMQFSREHGLTQLPNWHFLTGSTAQLKSIWSAYGVAVTPNPTGDVQHSSLLYFIDKSGNEAYVANPTHQKSLIPQWGKGIAAVSKSLL